MVQPINTKSKITINISWYTILTICCVIATCILIVKIPTTKLNLFIAFCLIVNISLALTTYSLISKLIPSVSYFIILMKQMKIIIKLLKYHNLTNVDLEKELLKGDVGDPFEGLEKVLLAHGDKLNKVKEEKDGTTK